MAVEGSLIAPMQIIGGDRVGVPQGIGDVQGNRQAAQGNRQAEASFTVEALSDTTVTITVEVLAPNSGDDSFFVWFDTGSRYEWHIHPDSHSNYQSLMWRQVGTTFALAEGVHTLHIGLREDGTSFRAIQILAGDVIFRRRGNP